jgi:predicted anti-sigma-YlaC factor YlaD
MSARESVHLTDEQLDDYVDGVMDATSRARAAAHLAACERCRRLAGDTREMLALAERERVAVSAPAELWPLVAASTIHVAEVRRRVLASMRGVLLAGAIALVAATALVTWKIARWTMAPRAEAPSAVVRPASTRGGVHAGHPIVPVPPEAPEPPQP